MVEESDDYLIQEVHTTLLVGSILYRSSSFLSLHEGDESQVPYIKVMNVPRRVKTFTEKNMMNKSWTAQNSRFQGCTSVAILELQLIVYVQRAMCLNWIQKRVMQVLVCVQTTICFELDTVIGYIGACLCVQSYIFNAITYT